MIVGVLDIQGDVSEHIRAVENTIGKGDRVVRVKSPETLREADCLIVPGGESTTIGKLVKSYNLDREISKFAKNGKPIMGTCAGLILLANEINPGNKIKQNLLGLMDMKVKRNAFGRQRESFEADLNIRGVGKYHAVFIRAPFIESVGNGVDVLARYNGRIVMARQKNILAVAFHPELTQDTRVHRYFLDLSKTSA